MTEENVASDWMEFFSLKEEWSCIIYREISIMGDSQLHELSQSEDK